MAEKSLAPLRETFSKEKVRGSAFDLESRIEHLGSFALAVIDVDHS